MQKKFEYPTLHLLPRFAARFIDILVILVISQLLMKLFPVSNNVYFFSYLIYNSVVILFEGRTAGRFLLGLTVLTPKSGLSRSITLLGRELLLMIVAPLIVLSLITFPAFLIHDRLFKTYVIRNDD